MTDCTHCHKLFSGKCKQCLAHMAEMAAFKYKIDNHVHHMARVAWRLQPGGSLPSETDNMVSSQPLTPLSTNPVRETQRRHILSYPTNTTFLGVPACKLAPGRNKEIGVFGRSETLRGASSSHESTEYVQMRPAGAQKYHLTTEKTKRGTSDKRPVIKMICNGSHPFQGFPLWFHSPRWEHGAGNSLKNTNHNQPCADFSYRRKI